MDGGALVTILLLLVLGIILAVTVIILVIAAIAKKRKRLAAWALGLVAGYVILVGSLYFAREWRMRKLEKFTMFTVEDNRVTILGEGTGSMGSGATYALSNEGVIQVVDEPCERVGMVMKFGYTFAPVAEGKCVIGFVKSDFGRLSYIDFYEVEVDADLQLEAGIVKHMEANEGELVEEVPAEYAFVDQVIDPDAK